MKKSFCSLALSLLSLAVGRTGAAYGAPPEVILRAGSQEITQAQLESCVQLAYQKLAAYLQADGAKVRFQLDGYRTILAGDFDRLPYDEAVSLPGKTRLEIMRLRASDGRGKTTAKYRSRLRPPTPLTVETWRSVVQGKTFGAVMALATDEPQLLEARALTTFKVVRTVGGETTSYRAAFLWLLAAASPSFRAYPLDPFTDGVDLALGERLRPATGARDRLTALDACLQQGKVDCGGEPPAPQCVASSSVYNASWQYLSGGENHHTGGHAFGMNGTFTCACGEDCSSTCEAVADFYCNDSQDISGLYFYHKAVADAATENGSTLDGKNVNVTCAAGAGCAVRECFTETFCSLSVGVGISHDGVSYSVSLSTSTDVLWKRTAKTSHTCAKCAPYTPPPPPPPPGGGGGDPVGPAGGDAGAGGSSWWWVDCGNDGTIDGYFTAEDAHEAHDFGASYCGAT